MKDFKIDFEKLEALEAQLIKTKDNFSSTLKNIIEKLDNIALSWESKRADDVLASIEIVKNNYAESLAKFENNISFVNKVVSQYRGIDAASTSKDSANINTIMKGQPKTTYEGIISFSDFNSNILNNIIEKEKQGQNSFDSYDMQSLSKNYYYTPNTAARYKEDNSFLQSGADNLDHVQRKIKDAGLWGTPSASRIISLWMLQTGFKIPATASKKIDGVGNLRGGGVGKTGQAPE